jgi:hypothetical protein
MEEMKSVCRMSRHQHQAGKRSVSFLASDARKEMEDDVFAAACRQQYHSYSHRLETRITR